MTCIVGVVKGNTVYLGGDRAATDGELNRTIIKTPKVFLKGDVGFGVCGLPKVMDALQHGTELPTQSGGDDKEFLVGTLVPAIREGLKRLDCTADHPEYGTCFHGAMLVAYRGALYDLQGNFQLVEAASGYASVGSGSKLALGSLASTKKVGNARKRVLMALEASTGNAGCAPPFDVVVVKKRGSLF